MNSTYANPNKCNSSGKVKKKYEPGPKFIRTRVNKIKRINKKWNKQKYKQPTSYICEKLLPTNNFFLNSGGNG
jgi:ribosomal protein L32E